MNEACSLELIYHRVTVDLSEISDRVRVFNGESVCLLFAHLNNHVDSS